MKTITLLGLAGIAFVSFSQPTWAGPRGSGGGFGGGSNVSSGGRAGGFAGGGSRAAPAFHGGGFRAAPALRSGGAYFTGRSVGRPSAAPRFYYGGNRVAAVRQHGFTRSVNRFSPSAGRIAAANRQPSRGSAISTAANRQRSRTGSIAGRNRVSDPRSSTAANRESFVKNHASERHDANNWHRDWDRHRAHFHNNRVFVFIGGFWWGLDPGYYPWDYYPYYDYGYPYDYNYGYPYDYNSGNYPYDYYQGNNDYDSAYVARDQYAKNPTVSAVQSQLARLGYYNGTIDGVLGDGTEAALARYQEDQDLSVTGTVDAATLQSLGVR
jgi:hypothetical protein